jgi:hypothetical protein
MADHSAPSKPLGVTRQMAIRGNKPKPVADKMVRGNPGNRPLTTLVPAPRSGEMMCPLQVAKNSIAQSYWTMYLGNAAPGHLAPLDAPLLARLQGCATLTTL